MKRSQWIMFSLLFVLTGGIYLQLMNNKKEKIKDNKEEKTTQFIPIRKVKNETRIVSLVSYGQLTSNLELTVSFEVQGKLERGDILMKPGTNFKKGQLLYRVNNSEAFYTLSARKSSLSNLVLNAMPDIELDFPQEVEKWNNFLQDIDPSKFLPELPKSQSSKEQMFVTSRSIFVEYYNLKSLESRMDKYIWIAPFDGTVVSIFAEPGSIANPGGQIAKIIKTSGFEVKVPIAIRDIDAYEKLGTAEFFNPTGMKVAEGKIVRVSNVINQETQSTDVFYSIRAVNGHKLYSGMFVNVSIDCKEEKVSMTIPRAVVRNGKVYILKNNELKIQDVLIVGSKPDSLYVSGLRNGQEVVLEQIEMNDKDVIYKGIAR